MRYEIIDVFCCTFLFILSLNNFLKIITKVAIQFSNFFKDYNSKLLTRKNVIDKNKYGGKPSKVNINSILILHIFLNV